MTGKNNTHYRRVETAAMLVVFASVFVSFLHTVCWNQACKYVNIWHFPSHGLGGYDYWLAIHEFTNSSGTVILLCICAIGIFLRGLRTLALIIVIVFIVCYALAYLFVRVSWLQSHGPAGQQLPTVRGFVLVACWFMIVFGPAIVPCAISQYLHSKSRRDLEASQSNNRYSGLCYELAHHDIRRFMQYVLIASSLTIFANALVQILDAFLLSDIPASWFSAEGATFILSAAIRIIWPLCLAYVAAWRMQNTTNIAKLVRWLLAIDLLRFLTLMAIHTPRFFLGIGYEPTLPFDPSVLERLWAVCGASLTWMVLTVLAMLPPQLIGKSAPICNRCGYLLEGLQNNRCPECGTSFMKHELGLDNL